MLDSTQPPQHDSRNSSKGVPLMPYPYLNLTPSMSAPHPSSPLPEAFERQDQVFAQAFSILQEAVTQRAFPAASIAVTHRGRLVTLKALGTFTYAEIKAGAPSFSRSSREEGILKSSPPSQLRVPHSCVLCEGWARRRKSLHTLRPSLLNKSSSHHSDGNAPLRTRPLRSRRASLRDSPRIHPRRRKRSPPPGSNLPHAALPLLRPARLRKAIPKPHPRRTSASRLHHPLSADPSTRAEYSDIGFIILGTALERLADESLDRFCQREVFAPLSMTNTTFNPPLDIAQANPSHSRRTRRRPMWRGRPRPQKAVRNIGAASQCNHAAPSANESSKARFRTKTPACSAALRHMPAFSRPPKTWRNSPIACSTRAVPSFAAKRSPSSPAANPPRPPRLARLAGTRPPRPRNPESFSDHALSAIWVTPERPSGSIPIANFQSPCSPTALGLTVATRPSGRFAPDSTMRSPTLSISDWYRMARRFSLCDEHHEKTLFW